MSQYKLYTDREENFNCDIALEGARLKDSFARIILETTDFNLVFKGSINQEGKCEIPIKPLRHLLETNDRGKMVLEVVADDTYFRPWESNFVVDSYKKVEVKINEVTIPSKPRISVSVNKSQKKTIKESPKPKKKNLSIIINELKQTLIKNDISIKNIKTKKKSFAKLTTEYFKRNNIKKNKNLILTKLVESLIKG